MLSFQPIIPENLPIMPELVSQVFTCPKMTKYIHSRKFGQINKEYGEYIHVRLETRLGQVLAQSGQGKS